MVNNVVILHHSNNVFILLISPTLFIRSFSPVIHYMSKMSYKHAGLLPCFLSGRPGYHTEVVLGYIATIPYSLEHKYRSLYSELVTVMGLFIRGVAVFVG